MISGLPPPTRQPNHLRAVCELGFVRRMKGPRHNSRQARQRQNVRRVVVEDGHQAKDLLRAEIFEVEVGNQFSWKIPLPLQPQDLILEIHQAAAIKSKITQATRSKQEISMLERDDV